MFHSRKYEIPLNVLVCFTIIYVTSRIVFGDLHSLRLQNYFNRFMSMFLIMTKIENLKKKKCISYVSR